VTIQKDNLEKFWCLSPEKVFELLASKTAGLDESIAAGRLEQFGKNVISTNASASAFMLFLSQFKSPVTLLLIIAAILSAFLGDATDTIIILIIVLISGILGFWQERGAANAVKELLKLVQLHCIVLRSGLRKEVSIEKIVPGDVICLTAGDIIPADSLIVSADQLFVDEAAFTGETYPVEKSINVTPAEATLSKRSNVLLMGSHVVSGKGQAVVVKTGEGTEFGKISSNLKLRPPETGFERGIRRFGYLLMEITLILVIIIFAINVFLNKPVLDSFLFSLALSVGLTPQLLPAIISVNLATGARRMAKQEVIVKRLSAIENFGSMDVLCSDKTGTITEGKVMLKDCFDVTGNHCDKVLRYAWLNASLQQGFHNPIDEAICNAYTIDNQTYRVLAEIPYDFIRKRLTMCLMDGTEQIAVTKGALISVLAVCTKVEMPDGSIKDIDSLKKQITTQYEQLSSGGFRTLGVAYKPANVPSFSKNDEEQMIFIGFVALFDPLKENVKETIGQMSGLGIKLKIITGDNMLIANSLAYQLGIEAPKILTGAEMQRMSTAALMHRAPLTDIFAEVEPNQKERIIIILKKAGHVVGFLGDGINDAPALHAADVGISVNTAVDVAKEAADIVLLSPGLAVLTDGVLEGRKTFTNTMKYIFMATSANFGNMFSMAGASLFLPFLPLLPKQILLTNLLTDFPEMAIATDKVDVVNIQSPQRWDIGFIKRFMIIFGLLSSVFDYITFYVLLTALHADEKTFQTGWFIESVISATIIVLVVRTRLHFFKSIPGKYLSMATIFIILLVLALPFTAIAGWFGFVVLNSRFYLLVLPVICLYMISAEMVKQSFFRHINKTLPKKHKQCAEHQIVT